jgi:hypothetical protein
MLGRIFEVVVDNSSFVGVSATELGKYLLETAGSFIHNSKPRAVAVVRSEELPANNLRKSGLKCTNEVK